MATVTIGGEEGRDGVNTMALLLRREGEREGRRREGTSGEGKGRGGEGVGWERRGREEGGGDIGTVGLITSDLGVTSLARDGPSSRTNDSSRPPYTIQ